MTRPGANEISGGVFHGPVFQAESIGTIRIGAEVPVPNMLPRTARHYVNNEALFAKMDRIHAECRAEGVLTVIAVVADPGMGASAAVRRWVHRHRADWEGRPRLYADLGPDAGGRSRDPLSVLEELLGALHVPKEDRQGGLNARAALLRSWTGGGPALVVLDHVESVAQVVPLLPGSEQSVVLLTCHSELPAMRSRLEAEILRLKPLELKDREDLLTLLGGGSAPERQRRRVALASGGRPLALRVSAELLATGALLPEEGPLTENGDGLPLPEVIDWTYRQFTDRDAHAYRLLGLHPTREFSYGAARALLADGEPEAVREVLHRLAAAGFLESGDGDTYALHRLVHEHARQRALGEESAEHRQAAEERVVDWYTRFAEHTQAALSGSWRHDIANSYAAYGSPVADPDPVIDAMRRSRGAVSAALRLAADTGRDAYAYRICQGLRAYCLKTGSPTDWLEALSTGRSAAARLGDPLAAARMEFDSGFAFLERWFVEEGDEQAARAHFAAALERAGEGDGSEGYRRTRSSVLEALGLLERKLGRPGPASVLLRDALAALGDLDHPRGRALLRLHLGRAQAASGQTDDAERELTQARAWFRDAGDRVNEAKSLAGLAENHVAAGHLAEATAAADEAAALMPTGYQRAEIHLLRGKVARTAGNPRAAMAAWHLAADGFGRVGSARVREAEELLRELGEGASEEQGA
ncbi:hypothetical protein OK074_6273 [Actinobacteria bacterium OK074]|nr:hypothetical protein OK074_6273 [Actinobacteria bacterium OK074]